MANAGDIVVGSIGATGLASLNATGAITDATAGADGVTDITAGSITLLADTGVGTTADVLELASGTINSIITDDGNIVVSNTVTGPTTVATLDTGTGAGTGAITFDRRGSAASRSRPRRPTMARSS